eukprot:CAMPEP_0182898478 /NCGR_PEP_ID=MMETSP0034_2-20130328/27502_1 /TAXON_ID=156128 /ORGANISM="Nephroselmis pyriformis, Strain CCMP717" /LENGTH=393 /DNA_ID=CAMNT_0025032451 /DNA_START=15 /DNA_END=1196 /DNA_ORIENTATION=-
MQRTASISKPSATVRLQGRRQAVKQAATARPIVAQAADAKPVPLMVRAARGEKIERPPAWMMRQAGRYQKAYRDLSAKYPGFRERSETTDLICEISLQPWNSFQPDGVILFSDILTPLPAMGIPFDIDETKGPLLDTTITTLDGLKMLTPLNDNLDKVKFVGESLTILQNEVGGKAAVLGFVGCPWTLATYIVEGKSTRTYQKIKSLAQSDPDVIHGLLSHLAEEIGDYVCYQIEAGADCIQMFDSWGGQLPPTSWEKLSKPYIEQIVRKVRAKHPTVPLTLYANGNGGLLERMSTVGVDIIGLDWTVDMADGRARLGDKVGVQGNVDPVVLFADNTDAITDAINDVVTKAGPTGHVLNLGHGVLVGTPEENVKHFFDYSKTLSYDQLFATTA